MSLLNWIFDIWQHSKISSLRDEVAGLHVTGGAQTINAVRRLERAIGELALAIKTVQRLAVEKGLCTAEEFQNKLAQIDHEDGISDGQSPV
jgi:hypothetical protein